MIPALFLTSRFRSGSTALWNMFRQVPEVTAYYEPLNERLLQLIKSGSKPQASHIGVKNYFDEYEGLPELSQYYSSEFGIYRLWLDAKANHPSLEKYISYLLSTAQPAKTAILKFNRIDFRLAWIKAHFPRVPLVHLYRSPRDSWISAVTSSGIKLAQADSIDINPYGIMTWAYDLALDFPFLSSNYIQHPYQRFYYLWKLSYLAGQKYADLSLSFEDDLLAQPQLTASKLLSLANLDLRNLDKCLTALVERPTQLWLSYRPATWFEELERECDAILHEVDITQWLSGSSFADFPTIKTRFPKDQVINWLKLSSQSVILNQINIEISLTEKLREAEIYNASLRSVLEKKDQEINGVNAYLAAKEKEVLGLNTQLKLLQERIEEEKTSLKSERDLLYKRVEVSESYAASLENAQTQLQSQWNSDHQALETALSESNHYSETLAKSLAEKNAYISNLEALHSDILAAKQYAVSIETARNTAEAYARSLEQEQKRLSKSLEDASTYAKSLEIARTNAENYARSLEEAKTTAESYTASLETARKAAEEYAQSLELDRENERKSAEIDRAKLLAELSSATALARSKRHALDVLLGFG